MSHATVTVKVSAERIAKHGGDLDAALAEMMAPFDEQTEDPRFLTFCDEEDEHRKEYENGSTKKIRTPEGAMLWPWDERFRVPGTIGTGSDTHRAPTEWSVTVPFKELYPTFDKFCEDYASLKRDEKTGRVGYWRNPNATWDWYVIGGRWTGHFPVKPGVACETKPPRFSDDPKPGPNQSDVVKLSDIDLDAVARITREKAEAFWERYAAWLKSPNGGWDSPREFAIRIGLLRVVMGPAVAGENEIAIPWAQFARVNDERATWTDVAKIIGKDDFVVKFGECFSPLGTYAALDDDGWHAPGTMGWFGCSSDKTEDYVSHKREFVRSFIKSAKPDDVLVCVDYHI